MNCLITLAVFLIACLILWLLINRSENFVVDPHYFLPNYQSGALMLRGDLPIEKTPQSIFQSRNGAGQTSHVNGFFNGAD